MQISSWNFKVCRFFLPLSPRRCFSGAFARYFRSIDAGDAVDEWRFLKHAFSEHLELRPSDQGRFHALHARLMAAPVVTQVCNGSGLAPEFQGHQELFSRAERGWATRCLLPSFAEGQHGFHLGERFRVHPGASTELLAVHLQRACQAVSLHPVSLAHDFRKRSNRNRSSLSCKEK
ncbi:hypothetical protein [Deinococcus sp. QL22]|uniref:hypothetical protein n=1 Tax=Deinococcus sp. QL22 TaxID=2939437 RepID=UPI0020180577|nr:hypothetical protein [Deinococcus sp. QL22]UQN08371.1 hypothetical protein M1R55_16700 [Deinococcus sp. QL22]